MSRRDFSPHLISTSLLQTSPATRLASRSAKVIPAEVSLADVVVFSHLRWDFVFQRPQHLLTRCAAGHRVYYVEEAIVEPHGTPLSLELREREKGVRVVVPHLPWGLSGDEADAALKTLVDRLFDQEKINEFTLWYYTPMALTFTRHLQPLGVVYDCMDELSLFKDAPPCLLSLEKELFQQADIVFTGGRTLFEHKKNLHPNIHAFPSSIEAKHFGKARDADLEEPADQRHLAGPKIGFFGVIDERMNLEILGGIAAAHPEWNVIVLGPVTKVDPAMLPSLPNIHYLGSKPYQDLPAYLKGWDAAILPFALNDSTRFISPTKTPEYLAAGIPVVSTSIRDVVSPYEDKGLVLIADTPGDFVKCIERQLMLTGEARKIWLDEVDNFLAAGSWERTWNSMLDLIRLSLSDKSTTIAMESNRPPAGASTSFSSPITNPRRRGEIGIST